jgi:hypothetical protein
MLQSVLTFKGQLQNVGSVLTTKGQLQHVKVSNDN